MIEGVDRGCEVCVLWSEEHFWREREKERERGGEIELTVRDREHFWRALHFLLFYNKK